MPAWDYRIDHVNLEHRETSSKELSKLGHQGWEMVAAFADPGDPMWFFAVMKKQASKGRD